MSAYHDEHSGIGAGVTIERTAVLNVAGIKESLVVEVLVRASKCAGADSKLEATLFIIAASAPLAVGRRLRASRDNGGGRCA